MYVLHVGKVFQVSRKKKIDALWLDSHRRNVLLPARIRQLHYLNRSYGYLLLVLANPSPISFLMRSKDPLRNR